jgi:phosphocarrier protein
MISQKVIVLNESGLHARPANVFVKEAIKHKTCTISIKKDGEIFNGKSIVSLLSACVKCGTEIELIADGEQEEEALRDMVAAVNSHLGE